MKKYVLFCAVIFALCRTFAQSNTPVKLALISETDEVMPAADLLTAKLSGDDKIQLLERDQIEKVYQEQSLSAANQDYLKLGRILGADGLLLLNVARTPEGTKLTARLIAVKPGVILADGNFPWSMKDPTQWSEPATAYLDSFLPKLSVLPNDAIPLSVVNLRSAINSVDGVETERQLKQLIIQRLSQEPRFFVLERQKMQLLGDEKKLKADDSAFWDGSYLLEGTVDQNGYSPNTITINARLTPPKGGGMILMEASGSRTNLAEVINQLAAKITDALKINSQVKPWNASDEAAQFFEEAKWALRWGTLSEAQAAADSAWALGKQDVDCATVRVKSYVLETAANVGKWQTGQSDFSSLGYNSAGEPLGPTPADSVAQAAVKDLLKEHPFGMLYQVTKQPGSQEIDYVFDDKLPELQDIDRARHALELYYAFSLSGAAAQSKALDRLSPWYDLGVEDLTGAAHVLQNFYFVPESKKAAADELAELRALARSVAKLISEWPSVHDSYFVGDRIASHDELSNTIETPPNIFRCEVNWGCFWQERPEDAVLLYSDLMSSPVFCYIHNDFWKRASDQPRLVAWNQEDQKNIPAIWNSFTNSLATSTNLLLQMEAKALARADAPDKEQAKAADDDLMKFINANRESLVANNVELFYLGWGLGYPNPELDAMDQEYWSKTIPGRQTAMAFEKQKQYLADFTPYDFQTFEKAFSSRAYTKAQVTELEPLIAGYKSNLLARAKTPVEKFKAQSDAQWIKFSFENQVSQILDPPASTTPTHKKNAVPKPLVAAKETMPVIPVTHPPGIVTQVITAGKFLAIPLDGLMRSAGLATIDSSRLIIVEHDWLEGKLLLSFEYSLLDKNYGGADGSAVALLDPATESWTVIDCPKVDFLSRNHFPHHVTLLHGELFDCDGGKIEEYDAQKQAWQALKISDGNNYELFAINGHLYATDENTIFEITLDGPGTSILASTRRQPPASALDTQLLGAPTLFEGPDHSLRVYTNGKIFSWTGSDWREDGAAPPVSSMPEALPNGMYVPFGPEIFPDGVVFDKKGTMDAGYSNGHLNRRADGSYGTLRTQDSISCLQNEDDAATLYLQGKPDWAVHFSGPDTHTTHAPQPLCKMPANLIPGLPVALRGPNLYILEDALAMHAVINQQHEVVEDNVADGNEYNAALLCFSRDFPEPQKVYLKLEPMTENPPDWLLPSGTNWLFCGNATGVWMLPLSQVDSAINAQKQIMLGQKTQAALAIKQAQQTLLAKYDFNHNGVIDPDEREAALDDPAFIESQLDVIDANQDGQLDLAELAYFDANHDHILEPKEEAGIGIALQLLAKRDLDRFDTSGAGALNEQDFEHLLRSNPANPFIINVVFQRADENHDGKIELDELESCLKHLLRQQLHPAGINNAFLMNQLQMESNPAKAAQEAFKLEVEAYWRDPASITHRPPSNGRPPFGSYPSPGNWPPGPPP